MDSIIISTTELLKIPTELKAEKNGYDFMHRSCNAIYGRMEMNLYAIDIVKDRSKEEIAVYIAEMMMQLAREMHDRR